MDDAKSYYNNLRAIQTMNMRIHEHNCSIENNKDRLTYIKNLISRRENNMEDFFKKVFNEG
jgi:hypothetical protein